MTLVWQPYCRRGFSGRFYAHPMAVRQAEIVGKFHPKFGEGIELSEDRRIANGKDSYSCTLAFSNDPIPNGVKFLVKILKQGSSVGLIIGVTTKSPNSGQLPQNLGDIYSHDQYWCAEIKSSGCTAHRKGQCRSRQWGLDCSAGNTFGCQVLETGELRLCYNERDVIVVCEGLPADKPFWGFVYLSGWMVEANYVIARVSETPSSHSPAVCSLPTTTQQVGASSTAQDILDYFRDSFIQCVVANTVIYDLEHADIISDGDLTEIKFNPDARQQNQILHRCLKRSCDEKALMEVCDMMIAVRGNRRMNALGRDMKCKLEGIEGAVCVP